MTRLLPLRRIALAATWLVLLAGLVGSTAWAQQRALDAEVFAIGDELRCPTCVSESVAESNSAIAREMRVLIQDQLDQGRTRAEILAFFQERYGDWILLNPPRTGVMLLVWLLPVAALLVGAAVMLVLIRRWRRAADLVVDVADDDRERVRAALAASGAASGAAHAGSDASAPAPRP
ncbi:MAG: cytochrome c-type biogenesis protein CcmH [Trueperaceae bacterium]|nr:cytochrome c-type biogenesis protein CcmH [Trueperaceae bacterium]